MRFEIRTGLDESSAPVEAQLTVPPGGTAKHRFEWSAGKREFGHEARVSILSEGKPVHTAAEYFSVGAPIWKTALQGSGFITWFGREAQFPEHVENNRSEIVDADHMEKIGKDRHLKVVGKEAKEVGESHSFTVKGDVIEVFKANHSEATTGDYYLKADNVVIEGMTSVTIKVGGSSIAIAADGIALKTSGLIKIESTATMDLKAEAPLTMQSSATAELKSPMTTVKGDGTLTLKGGMTMIN